MSLNGELEDDRPTPQVTGSEEYETLPDDYVVIAGAGPVGLVLATVLSSFGIKSILLERNQTTTKWPKMDLTNARSMEYFRRLGLAEGIKKQGVAPHFSCDVLISSGLSAGPEALTKWQLPSVNEMQAQINQQNDGTQPLEPWLRISQAILEKWMAGICDQDPNIDVRFGWKVLKAEELDSGARITAINMSTGTQKTFTSRYAVGCDGASSRLRRDLGIPLEGPGLVPMYALLVHFKSRDLARLHRQGQFWHVLFPHPVSGIKGAIIAQDATEIFTTHLFLPLGTDESKIDSHDAVYSVLGGMGENYKIKIDEVLVRSTWQPRVLNAQKYNGPKGRIFLAGDAVHQVPPTGGYGFNGGLGDAFNIGWKLAAVMKGHGGPHLLNTYEQERHPVATTSIAHSGLHMGVHLALPSMVDLDPLVINEDSEKGRAVRKTIHEYYQAHDGENKDIGIEMGYRYTSDVTIPDNTSCPPEFSPRHYIPSTYPGLRAPHLFLNDGSAIFDHCGKDFTLVEFADEMDRGSKFLIEGARKIGVPLTTVTLNGERHAQKIWGTRLALIRPDGHVAWRGENVSCPSMGEKLLLIVTGHEKAESKNGVVN